MSNEKATCFNEMINEYNKIWKLIKYTMKIV